MPVNEEIIKYLKYISTATIYGVLGGKADNYVMKDIRPLKWDMKVYGRATTIQYISFREEVDVKRENIVHKLYNSLKPGDVVVASTGGRTDAGIFGDIILLSFKVKGVRGIVTDGSIRDAPQVLELNLPVFVRSTTPAHIGGKLIPYAYNVEVDCGGVVVRPGDIILGDYDCVIVIPQERAEKVIQEAIEVERKEYIIREMIKLGVPLEEAYPPKKDLYEEFKKRVKLPF
ncbi:MAG: hypothetical protein DRJ59_05275 [Thermoprotei archaeon]|nr:MAG: hypothetical protein DRJ59_05275 [Thermoprotei archaeon]